MSEVSQIVVPARDIDHEVAEEIEAAIWKKYILNCAYNAESAYYDNTIGQLRSDPVKRKRIRGACEEAYQVGRAKE